MRARFTERTDRRGYPLAGKRLCPAPFHDIKEGVGKQASAPMSAGETVAMSHGEPKTKERSNVFSPTADH